MTNKQLLWQQYYQAIKLGRHAEAKELLAQIHTPATNKNTGRGGKRGGGCSKCRKRFS